MWRVEAREGLVEEVLEDILSGYGCLYKKLRTTQVV
jgi:hypothetical protein